MDLWTSPTDRREPCGPCGQPVDNADALPTACPHSRASRPQAPQDQPPVILRGQHRTTLRRGCLHRPFKTTSASHSNRSQHRPRPGSPPIPSGSFPYGIRLFFGHAGRFIPALRGNTHATGRTGCCGPVHPRAGGEYSRAMACCRIGGTEDWPRSRGIQILRPAFFVAASGLSPRFGEHHPPQ